MSADAASIAQEIIDGYGNKKLLALMRKQTVNMVVIEYMRKCPVSLNISEVDVTQHVWDLLHPAG